MSKTLNTYCSLYALSIFIMSFVRNNEEELNKNLDRTKLKLALLFKSGNSINSQKTVAFSSQRLTNLINSVGRLATSSCHQHFEQVRADIV